MFKQSMLALALGLLALVSACSSDETPYPAQTGGEGFYIVNEGAFGGGNASISFYDRSTESVTNDLFSTANGIPLGDQAQSMYVHQGLGYIVVQGSGKVEVVDLADFSIIATITDGIESPRYFVAISESKGYISDWGDGFASAVKVVDLTNYTVIASIPTGSGSNKMLMHDGKLYVANNGGFDKDQTVKVIDTNTDLISATLQTAYNPDGMQVDADGNIWVACTGHTAYFPDWTVDEANSEPGALVKFAPDGTQLARLDMQGIGSGAKGLVTNSDGTRLYFIGGGYTGQVFAISHTASALPSTPLLADPTYYGLSFDPVSRLIIACEVPDFSSSGSILLADDSGSIQATYSVGIGPNGCVFK